MQAIQVKYLGATNYRGDRLKATAQAGSKTVSREYGLNVADQALELATEFANELGWLDSGLTLAQGALPNGDYCHVLITGNTDRLID